MDPGSRASKMALAPPRGAQQTLATGAVLGRREFLRLSSFIAAHCGIRMPPAKKVMLETRLRRRIRHLEMDGFGDYCDYALDHGSDHELVHMIDAVTTNKTDFFREPSHFDYLARQLLPLLPAEKGAGARRPVMFWSAGCASGEEPYSLAMILAEYAREKADFRFSILGTDISNAALALARRAIYAEERVAPVPMALRRRYLLRSRDASVPTVRITPALRSLVRFAWLNFVDTRYALQHGMDVIFCRNVFIYFRRKTQEAVLRRLCSHLVPEGHIFLGHSESINGLDVPLVQVAPTVYRHAVES